MAAVDVYTGHHQPTPAGRLSASQPQYHFSYRHDAPEALYSYAQLHPIFQIPARRRIA